MSGSRRRWLAPEVVQTSAMDCGPAVLKSLLEGFGVPVQYGRLREACQTGVDGTSIDALEAVAGRLGLDATQEMIPVDHLLRPEADALPAVVVVRLPDGLTHFVLVWRRVGPWVQVMDPAVGRRWVRVRQLLDEVYVHDQRVPAAAWHEWATSDAFRRPLLRRLRDLRSGRVGGKLLAAAGDWQALAALDAATRCVDLLVKAGALRPGRAAGRMIAALAAGNGGAAIPDGCRSVRAADGGDVVMRGAVLIRVRGRSEGKPRAEAEPLGPELEAALHDPPPRPGRELVRLLCNGRRTAAAVLAVGLVVTAVGAVLEALLLRGVVDVGRYLALPEQRLAAVAAFGVFGGLLLAAEWWTAGGLARLGRQLEARLRAAFQAKIPRLNDRYFQSRPTSDMADRAHALQHVRRVPELAGQFLRAGAALVLTAIAIAWADPAVAAWAALAAVAAAALPLACNPWLTGLDLRVRTHAGALSRFYLDAFHGLTAVQAHAAEQTVAREHEGLLTDWVRAGRQAVIGGVVVESVQLVVGFALAFWLLWLHVGRGADTAAALLLAYWAASLPAIGGEIAAVVRQYPGCRNVTLRLLELLGAPEEDAAEPPAATAAGGVGLTFESVTVRAAGHTILSGVDLHVPAGQHVAVVGSSGAGKSSLVGLLLGWHQPAAGRVLVDGATLTATGMEALRRQTVWVDPTVHLWNTTLLGNLLYGSDGPAEVRPALDGADLYGVLSRLPDGLQTPLGEGGGRLSGGEGQRVRLARGLLKASPRLVVLDEPFRGLDRDHRRTMFGRARRAWAAATLFCVTHDIGETHDFDRVLVVEDGRVVEDGTPAELAADAGSRYRALLDAEDAVRTGWLADTHWRRLRLENGVIDGGDNPERAADGPPPTHLAGRPARRGDRGGRPAQPVGGCRSAGRADLG